MRYAFCVDSRAILTAQTIKQRNLANIFTAIAQSEATAIDAMQSPLSYARAFEEDYDVQIFDVRIWDFVEDDMFSNI